MEALNGFGGPGRVYSDVQAEKETEKGGLKWEKDMIQPLEVNGEGGG